MELTAIDTSPCAVVKITGVSAHPGYAKGKLVNALHLAAEVLNRLPLATQSPEVVDGRDGFLHVYEMTGTAAEAITSNLFDALGQRFSLPRA